MNTDEQKGLLEAMFFISGDVLSLSDMKKIIELPDGEIRRLVESLIVDYRERQGGMMIVEIANGFQMVSNPIYAKWLKEMRKRTTENKLSMAAVETLSIIAYKQPIIKAEIEHIRGIGSDGTLKTLLDKRLVKITGRKEGPGKPLLYGTTKTFLQYFGLKDLSELPTLKEFTKEE